MSTPASAVIPFKKDEALAPDDPAFTGSVYQEPSVEIQPVEIITCVPQIICSPLKSGKTTLSNQIQARQEEVGKLGGEETLSIDISIDEEGYSEKQFRKVLADRFDAAETDTLQDIIRSSKIRKGLRSFLRIVNADNLSATALRWLLYGVRGLLENPETTAKYKVQIIIDGSFSLDTLTGQDSEFPMPHKYAREFTRAEQTDFVYSGLSQLNIELERYGYIPLWEATFGDKYLTQALCLELVKGYGSDHTRWRSKPIVVKERWVQDCVDSFTKKDFRLDPLGKAIVNSLAQLSNCFATKEFALPSLLRTISSEWEDLPNEARKIAYRGGIVRRRDKADIDLRAPLVLGIFDELRGRVQQVRTLIESTFSPDEVIEIHRDAARDTYERVMQAAYANSLRILHIGAGKKTSDEEVTVDALAWGQGQYQGTWEVRTDESIRKGDEVWCMLWAWDVDSHPKKRQSEVCVFKIKEL